MFSGEVVDGTLNDGGFGCLSDQIIRNLMLQESLMSSARRINSCKDRWYGIESFCDDQFS